MAIKLEWREQARRDLLDIYLSIGVESPGAAERFFDRIEVRTNMLREQPRLGPLREDVRASTRMLVVNPYLIFSQ